MSESSKKWTDGRVGVRYVRYSANGAHKATWHNVFDFVILRASFVLNLPQSAL